MELIMTLDHQEYFDVCNHCQQSFQVIRGSVFEEGEGIAIYLAAAHGCSSSLVDLAIAIREGYTDAEETCAVFIKARPNAEQVEMTVVDPQDSFWRTEEYLGRSLARDEALTSPLIHSFFHIADHILTDIPELRNYFAR